MDIATEQNGVINIMIKTNDPQQCIITQDTIYSRYKINWKESREGPYYTRLHSPQLKARYLQGKGYRSCGKRGVCQRMLMKAEVEQDALCTHPSSTDIFRTDVHWKKYFLKRFTARIQAW